MAAKYLFGDSDAAAHRLELLARVFRQSTRAFIAEASNAHVGLAVDLGCGCGFTTATFVYSAGPRDDGKAQRRQTRRMDSL